MEKVRAGSPFLLKELVFRFHGAVKKRVNQGTTLVFRSVASMVESCGQDRIGVFAGKCFR